MHLTEQYVILVIMQLDLQQRCVAAFKQGDHDEAERLVHRLQRPGDITTEFRIPPHQLTKVTLLHLAAYHGWLDIIKIIKDFFNCNCTNSTGSTPLHYAAVSGSLAVIAYLITELDCDPAISNNDGNLPLHIACRNGRLKCYQVFHH